MILELGMVPAFARRAFAQDHAVFVDLTPERGRALSRADAAPERAAAQPRSPEERRPARRAPRGFAPLQVVVALAGVLLLVVASPPGPDTHRHGRVSSRDWARGTVPPVTGGRPAPLLLDLSPLDRLAGRVEAIESALEERFALGLECAAACVVGVESVKARAGEVACRCRKGPNVGVHPMPSAKAREPEELGLRHPVRVRVDEPIAGGVRPAGDRLALGGTEG